MIIRTMHLFYNLYSDVTKFCSFYFLSRSNININDVLGNYSLTLIDSLDTLLIMGNISEFKRAVKLVIENVSFEQDSTIQVFEASIR